MWIRRELVPVVVLAALAAGCSCGEPAPPDGGLADAGPADGSIADGGIPDAGARDAQVDGGQGADAAVDRAVRASFFGSSGGGELGSPAYRGRFSVGAPQPAGTTAGAGRTVHTGPTAARP